MASFTYSPEAFLSLGKEIFIRNLNKSRLAQTGAINKFKLIFGTHPYICSVLWDTVAPIETIHAKSLPIHLLWALLFMRQCNTRVFNGSHVGVDEKTFKKWSHLWIEAIAELSADLIKWENRFKGDWHYWTFSVDGIHCRIKDPKPFWTGWHSEKSNGAGLAYEVCVAVASGDIVWIRGPFPPGRWNDLQMFDSDLIAQIVLDKEKGVADRGYKGREQWLATPWWNWGDTPNRDEMHERIRGRHEQVNSRFKTWGCLERKFRHQDGLHQNFFYAVACIVQLEIQEGVAHQFGILPLVRNNV